jgi:kynureninase
MTSDAYLLYHSIGQYPDKAADLTRAMAGFADVWGAADDGQWPVVLDKRARFVDRWRVLLDAPQGTVTTCESVTQGLAMLMGALPAGYLRGRRVLVAADCFPSNHFLLAGLQASLGFQLHTVPLRQGATWVEDDDIATAWTQDVALALLTWVSSTSSHRSDVAALAAHGRSVGSLVGVDLTQAVGLLPFSVMDPAVDFAISTSLKWMCGTPGAGAMYVAPALTTACAPTLRGWFSQDNPFNWDIDSFAYAPDIRRFDSGTPGVMAAAASLPAMDWHAGLDHGALLGHNRHLTARLIDGVQAMDLPLVTPLPEPQRGGSVMVRLPDRNPAPAVVAALRARAVWADARGQTLRLSPGVMTSETGVERALEALAEVLT